MFERNLIAADIPSRENNLDLRHSAAQLIECQHTELKITSRGNRAGIEENSLLVVLLFLRLIYLVIVGEMEAVCLHAVFISHDIPQPVSCCDSSESHLVRVLCKLILRTVCIEMRLEILYEVKLRNRILEFSYVVSGGPGGCYGCMCKFHLGYIAVNFYFRHKKREVLF